jgi:hypothetical protein
MPPKQNQQPTLPNSNPDYNFIFNNQKPQRRFSLKFSGNSLGKLALLIIGGCIVLGIVIIVLSSLFGPKINTKQIVDIMARDEEIRRVSTIVVQKTTDLNTANLASTTSAALTSDESRLNDYLNNNKVKAPPKELVVYINKNTDGEIDSAEQNNRLSEYYNSYLKKVLTDYQTAIKTAYDGTNGTKIRSELQEISDSTKTILSAPQLASASPQ